MGRFMHAWSQVELSLHMLFQNLSGAAGKTGQAIAHAIPDIGRMADLLTALGGLNLPEEDKKELKEIRKYLLVQARYRNSIVHAMWPLRPNIEKRPIDGLIHDKEWVRVFYVIDRSELGRAVLGVDKQAHDKFVFNVPRIQHRAKKAIELSNWVRAFALKLYRRTKAQRNDHAS